MSNRRTLVTFGMGSARWLQAARRLARQGGRCGWFTDVEVWDAKRLQQDLQDFWAEHRAFIHDHSRGWGLWVWRPAIIQWHLERAGEGAVFAFLDAGCELNPNSTSTRILQGYFDHARDAGLAAMQIGEPTSRWCKPDLLTAAQCEGLSPLPQLVEPGVLFTTGSAAALECVRSWMDWCVRERYHFLDDSPSISDSPADYREHRHDQAVLTCVMPASMTIPHASYFPGRWRSDGASQPVWACRNSLPVLAEQPTPTATMIRQARRAVHTLVAGMPRT